MVQSLSHRYGIETNECHEWLERIRLLWCFIEILQIVKDLIFYTMETDDSASEVRIERQEDNMHSLARCRIDHKDWSK